MDDSHSSSRQQRRDRQPKHNSNSTTSNGREIAISRALSKLLRHQAQNERIPISPEGWVRLDHLLAWQGLSAKRLGGGRAASMEEIFSVVKGNEKRRFALMCTNNLTQPVTDSSTPGDSLVDLSTNESETGLDAQTTLAMATFSAGTNTDPKTYLIRATQGHSIKTIAPEDLLTPITSSDCPTTCVHGTFYGSWPLILRSGGLKAMGRNHIHFASGPALSEIMPTTDSSATGEDVDDTLVKNKVISGMRSDAQILIYIDLARCLRDIEQGALNMKWWLSGNGVILTEGLETDDDEVQSSTRQDETKSRPPDTAGKEGLSSATDIPASEHPNRNTSIIQTGSELIQLGTTEDNEPATPKPISTPIPPPLPSTTQNTTKAHYPSQNQNHNHNQNYSENKQNRRPKHTQHEKQKLVPMEYWSHVVEIKRGLGLLWTRERGVLRDLPAELASKGVPRGKPGGAGRGGGGGGGGGGGSGRGRGGGAGKERESFDVRRGKGD